MGRTMDELAELIRNHPNMNLRYTNYEVAEMRTWIKKPYDADSWRRKVDRMPTAQVIAVFRQMCKAGRFTSSTKPPKAEPHWQQMTLWDYIHALGVKVNEQ